MLAKALNSAGVRRMGASCAGVCDFRGAAELPIRGRLRICAKFSVC